MTSNDAASVKSTSTQGSSSSQSRGVSRRKKMAPQRLIVVQEPASTGNRGNDASYSSDSDDSPTGVIVNSSVNSHPDESGVTVPPLNSLPSSATYPAGNIFAPVQRYPVTTSAGPATHSTQRGHLIAPAAALPPQGPMAPHFGSLVHLYHNQLNQLMAASGFQGASNAVSSSSAGAAQTPPPLSQAPPLGHQLTTPTDFSSPPVNVKAEDLSKHPAGLYTRLYF